MARFEEYANKYTHIQMMAGDHKKISQELFGELRQHFTEQEILELGWRVAIFVGYE